MNTVIVTKRVHSPPKVCILLLTATRLYKEILTTIIVYIEILTATIVYMEILTATIVCIEILTATKVYIITNRHKSVQTNKQNIGTISNIFVPALYLLLIILLHSNNYCKSFEKMNPPKLIK